MMNQSVVFHQTVEINEITIRSQVRQPINGLSDLLPTPSSGTTTTTTNKKASPLARRTIGSKRRPKRENIRPAFIDNFKQEGFFTLNVESLSPDGPIKSKQSFSFGHSSPDSGFVPEPAEPGRPSPGSLYTIGTSMIGGSYYTQASLADPTQPRGCCLATARRLCCTARCTLVPQISRAAGRDIGHERGSGERRVARGPRSG
jgi:hypothetical protein